MLAFFDESGDAGFKFDSGSSQYFTTAIVYFSNEQEAQNCDDRIE